VIFDDEKDFPDWPEALGFRLEDGAVHEGEDMPWHVAV